MDHNETSRTEPLILDLGRAKNASMIKGFNSDINARGKKYHVQTEDWGSANPFLVTRIYLNGAVVKTLKTSHETALRTTSIRSAEGLKQALQKQHSETIDALIAGTLI